MHSIAHIQTQTSQQHIDTHRHIAYRHRYTHIYTNTIPHTQTHTYTHSPYSHTLPHIHTHSHIPTHLILIGVKLFYGFLVFTQQRLQALHNALGGCEDFLLGKGGHDVCVRGSAGRGGTGDGGNGGSGGGGDGDCSGRCHFVSFMKRRFK